MSSDKDVLISMGFDPARVEWALRATGGRGLQPAMDHIIEHEGQPIPDPSAPAAVSTTPSAGTHGGAGEPMDEDDEELEALKAVYGKGAGSADAAAAAAAEAKSIKCSQCGRTFRNTALANYHAEKSGHDQFEESTEEIKPLTEEEKKQRLEELRTKMSEKKARKAVEDAKEQRANEEIRRKAGKDMGKIKEDLQAKQLAKEAEQKKREKIEEAKARAAIKAQIEADKRERAVKAAREKALRDGQPITDATGYTPAPAAASSSSSAAGPPAEKVSGRDFKETRLQIRMASGGQPYTTTLSSDATLREVAEFLAGQTLSVDVETVTFSQHFPRKQFSKSDFARTLRELGLTPSAVLIAS
ncbi:hypothetical protein JAAARDRAFT_150857 [Jaapia argillacea MUCL 33604]|uniref:UBX domain-containing protein n=1 Tax=Jaapia argillacea MUCL 33604 TaxID=933084 RepID=A0A067QH36_9AGAM|nr:hypothetical protein JAAARDRAFT_150857 [Jaapia argillacea MUCL 33604]